MIEARNLVNKSEIIKSDSSIDGLLLVLEVHEYFRALLLHINNEVLTSSLSRTVAD